MQSLRGVKAKEKFIRDYTDIKVLTYRVLLNGDMRKNQCGGELTDKYYHFIATHKYTLKKEEFFLGYDCAHQLMAMLHIPIDSIKLFNPFKQESSKSVNNGQANFCDYSHEKKFTTLGNQLFDLINLIHMGLSLKETNIIDEIHMHLRENPNIDPPQKYFKSLNTILIKYETTIQLIINNLQQNNKEFRKFDFTQARQYLQKYFEKQCCNNAIQF